MNLRKAFTASALGLVVIPAAMLLSSTAGAQDSPGQETFQKKCLACHGEAAPPTIKGPSLKGVFGRTIASEKSYTGYSDGLKGKQGKWTAANLDAFLTKPSDFAPGTKMKASVADPAQRAEIISILKTLK